MSNGIRVLRKDNDFALRLALQRGLLQYFPDFSDQIFLL